MCEYILISMAFTTTTKRDVKNKALGSVKSASGGQMKVNQGSIHATTMIGILKVDFFLRGPNFIF